MAISFHFLLRQGWAIPDLAVPLATVKGVGLVACRRPERAKESRRAVAAAGFFAARSSPGSDCSFAVGLSDSLPCLVIAAGLSVAAGPAPVVAAGSVVAAVVVLFLFVADPVCSVCPAYSVRSFAAATGKGRADFVSYSLVLRFSFLRNRNCLSPL